MLFLTVLFFLIYLALTENVAPANLLLGLLLAVGVALLLRPEGRRTEWRRLPAALLALGRYLLLLLYDLIAGGLQVARIVLSPSLPLRPGIIAIPSCCESELATALSTHAITLSPGELVVEIDEDGVLYTHVLDVTQAEAQIAEAQRLRQELLGQIVD